jgi:hypothetical protein
MSQPQPAPFQPPSQPPKSYWTAGKIIALVLVAILVTGVSGFAAFNYLNGRTSSPTGTSSTCSNGATNPPSCTSYSPCSNGANNPPACTTFNPCVNGASNPPTCNQFPSCSNGATNYPSCTVYNVSVSLTCTADGGNYYGNVGTIDGPFGGWCTALVTDSTVPTGMIGWSCDKNCVLGTPNPCCGAPPLYSTTCTLSAVSSTSSDCGNRGFPVQPTNGYYSSLTLYATYQGDATHLSSSSVGYTFTAPSSVSVAVNAAYHAGCIGCSVTGVDFTSGIITYHASCPLGINYCSTVSLPNLQSYTVKVYYSGTFGSGVSCTRYMDLYQFSSTASGQFDC